MCYGQSPAPTDHRFFLFFGFVANRPVSIQLAKLEVNMNVFDPVVWRVSPDVRATYSEDGAVLLDINKGLCYTLNAVGSRIWVTIEDSAGGISLEGIVSALETLFRVPHQQLEADAKEYLGNLVRMGLIHRNGAVSSADAARGAR
jgi:hypothetical protein